MIDADYVGDPDTTGNLITWNSKKQNIMSRSSYEAEYKTLTTLATEIRWTTYICKDLHHPIYHVPKIYYDNNSTIFMACNLVIKQRFEHIETNINFIRELISKNLLT